MAVERLCQFEFVTGDITKEAVDCIVNAANTTLLGGGGVDGAIHRAAGPGLLEACRALGGCPTGGAKITKGYRLPATWVIHTVGPVWQGGGHLERELLGCCYRNSLGLAAENRIGSIAFPAISTGAYGFPKDRAASIAIAETLAFFDRVRPVKAVRFVCFTAADTEIYRRAWPADPS